MDWIASRYNACRFLSHPTDFYRVLSVLRPLLMRSERLTQHSTFHVAPCERAPLTPAPSHQACTVVGPLHFLVFSTAQQARLKEVLVWARPETVVACIHLSLLTGERVGNDSRLSSRLHASLAHKGFLHTGLQSHLVQLLKRSVRHKATSQALTAAAKQLSVLESGCIVGVSKGSSSVYTFCSFCTC